MSNQQLGTVIGAAVGFFVPVVGVALGASIGGAVGALLTEGPKTEGPRLDDLKVSASTYGIGIPILHGTERMGGNCIWSTDKLEIATTEGGKGGAPEHTSYRYYVHQRYGLCETPRDGSTVSIVRIFVDGKLQWDARSGIPLGSALASAENLFTAGTLWQGDENQLPDGNEEPWEGGPGSVPAYRGIVSYSVVALECPNGRIPQLSFVVSTSAQVADEITEFAPCGINTATGGALIHSDQIWEWWQVDNGFGQPQTLHFSHVSAGSNERVGRMDISSGGYTPYPVAGTDSSIIKAYPTSGELVLIDLQDRTKGTLINVGSSGPGIQYGRAAFDDSADLYVIASAVIGTTGNDPIIVTPQGTSIPVDPMPGLGNGGVFAFYGGVVHAVVTDGARPIYVRRSSDGTSSIAMPDIAGPVVDFGPRASAMHVDATGVFVYVVGSTGTTSSIYKVDVAAGTWTQLCADAGPSPYTIFNTASSSFWGSNTAALVGPTISNPPLVYNFIRFDAVSTDPVKVSDIIADLCERIGETRFDVSEIPGSDTVFGYKIASVASARANIDPLLTAFGIYVVDEDGLIKFKKRSDLTSVATVSYDELGQAEDGAEPGDPMPLNHTQEIDLPRSATVSYIEPNFDFQVASEPYYREVTDSIEDLIIDLPIALTSSNQAKQVAQWAVYERALAQNTRTCKLSRKYAFVSPGDGLTIEYPRGTSRLWFVASTTDTGALCEFNLQPGDAQLLTQTGIGATGYPSQNVSPIPANTRAQILDMPIVRDVDNNAGVYVALDSYTSVPANAELLVGDVDDADSMDIEGSVSQSAPIGFAETVPGAAPSGFVDEVNLITVNLGDDVFENVTRDVLLAGGGEFWAYGAPGRWEIGASATGDSLGSGRFTLSRHLRGLFGTEQYTGTHESGDTFVLLRIVGMLRPNMSVGELGQTKYYRAITKGRSQDSAPSQAYANTGEGLMPLSPVNLRRAAANRDLSVDRRSRLAMNNLTGSLPLGEATESYQWEFYTSGAYTTLIGTTTTTTATITEAQQTAIGVTPSAAAFVRVAQISDSVGAGHELQATA